ncbi:hypothetical protein AKJ09_01638 [Labilithrix luteola]|uniref:Carbohydrate kinase PfkB domain-containing protein n=1 Tax=Labilithrix luteola TaxID=1391654 RepID=A0A0K1PPC4_9BACT|nr:PfkB family carbohydrate kinase [Labilithrix luteola]AKU94974.1 hypothetical protein AKJ09_01638 [Labilithrix luteola]
MSVHSEGDILIVGHVTCDLVEGQERLGGAASYATRAAVDKGLAVDLVTAAPPDFELLAPLLRHANVRATVVPSERATSFSLSYEGDTRVLRRLARAADIVEIPAGARVVYLAPVAGEIAPSIAESIADACVVVGLQGWMRRFDDDGLVLPIDPPPLRGARAVVFSEQDHPDADALAVRIARDVPVVALTRGSRGATLYIDGSPHAIAAAPANEVDPTGAGDVFGAILAIELGAGRPPIDAANAAALVAAQAVSRKNVFTR